MGFLAVSAVFCLCLAGSLATYGHDHKSYGPRAHYGGPHGGKLDEPRIHLDSPKIILNRPSINVQGSAHSPILEDGPILLENEKSLYYGKSQHGIHEVPAPVFYDSGYSSGKVLDISAPIQVINHAPIVHERPILIRRPVVVSKGLTATQDQLEKLHYATGGHYANAGGHYANAGGHYAGGHAIAGDYAAVPISKGAGLHERTVVYGSSLGHGGYGLGHGLGHAGVVSAYSSPVIVEQPKAYIGHSDYGYSTGKALHGGSLYGGSLHGGSYHHGGALHGGSLHGAALHGGSFHGAGGKKY